MNKDIEKRFLGIDRNKVPKWFDELCPEEKPKGICVKFNKGADMSEDKFENIDQFCSLCCEHCRNEYYCPFECELLDKARKMPLEKINTKWIEYEGDIRKVIRYIKQYKFMFRRKP